MSYILKAINRVMGVNGESPVTDAMSTNPAAVKAKNKIVEVTEDLQSKGWWFNRETTTLQPDLSGHIILPDNTVSVDPTDPYSTYVQRGFKLYDIKNSTFVINKPVKVCITLELDFDDLPAVARSYVVARSKLEYCNEDSGDTTKMSVLAEAVKEAWTFLQRDNLNYQNISNQDSPMGIQLSGVGNTSGRRRPNFED